MTHKTAELEHCINNCSECAAVCIETMTHFLEKGGDHASAGHIRLLLDCADICQTAAQFMLRGSDIHGQVCGVCADVCRRCAEACEHLAASDEEIAHCAEVCRRCEASCRQMAAVSA